MVEGSVLTALGCLFYVPCSWFILLSLGFSFSFIFLCVSFIFWMLGLPLWALGSRVSGAGFRV